MVIFFQVIAQKVYISDMQSGEAGDSGLSGRIILVPAGLCIPH